MNRAHFQPPFDWSDLPPWGCPRCRAGTLHLKNEKIISHETEDSKEDRNYPNWELEWIANKFFTVLQCSSPRCGEYVHLIGNAKIVYVPHYRREVQEQEYREYLSPLFSNPAFLLIDLPEKCPDDVFREVVAASSLYWSNYSASANCLRRALELLMTSKKISKTKVSKKGKRVALNLHERIEKYKEKNQEIGTQLEAVKWLGNLGSHSPNMDRDKLLDAFELIEYALEEIYKKRRTKLKELSQSINKKKG